MKTFNVEYNLVKIDTNTDKWKNIYKEKMGKFTYEDIETVTKMFLDKGFKGEVENFGDSAYIILYSQEVNNVTTIEASIDIIEESQK